MNKLPIHISTFWSRDRSRKAEVFKDKYHYIIELYSVHTPKSMVQLIETRLLHDVEFSVAEDLAEDFVDRQGEFSNRINKEYE